MNSLQPTKEIELILSNIIFWDKCKAHNQTKENVESFWTRQNRELETERFWTEQIKECNDSLEKLTIALNNIPLPRAFNSAAIELRKLIRSKIKRKSSHLIELSVLYWLAAINSLCIPYSKILEEPGINVLMSIPGDVIKKLSVNYDVIGYRDLTLLNKSDIKLLTDFLGEPSNHTTLNLIYADLWKKYEIELKTEKDKDLQDFFSNLRG